jgi:D-alanyl-D-alanine carboxypeptidase/D-alanyl-D-alanine-endopeptidase (penicillin-binding protein 4)
MYRLQIHVLRLHQRFVRWLADVIVLPFPAFFTVVVSIVVGCLAHYPTNALLLPATASGQKPAQKQMQKSGRNSAKATSNQIKQQKFGEGSQQLAKAGASTAAKTIATKSAAKLALTNATKLASGAKVATRNGDNRTVSDSKRGASSTEIKKPLSPLLAALSSANTNMRTNSPGTAATVLLSKAALTRDDSLKALNLLRESISQVLNDKVLEKADIGIALYSLTRRREVFYHNATLPLTPASTTKLLPTFSALEQFGTEYLVRTTVCTDAVLANNGTVKDGVLQGNVYLVGHGDPLLSISDIENLAVQLKNMGVVRLTGNVYGDDTFFDRLMSRQEYSGDDDEVQPTGPISALSVQKNLITVIVSAGAKQGEPVRVQTFPSSDAFTFSIQAVVKATKPVKARRNRWTKPALEIRQVSANDAAGTQHFVISGTLNPNTTVSKLFFIQNPALVAADMFRKRMEMFGIVVEGKSALKKTPNSAAILAEFVRPLTDILKVINKKSDNFCAEHVFKMLGSPLVTADVSSGSVSGRESPTALFSTTAENRSARASVEQIQSILRDHAIPHHLWSIYDGSGLSRRNKIAPVMLVRLLEEATTVPFAEEFRSTLAVAGLDGTIEHRMRGTPAEYKVLAKTGTHKNVSALAGYLRTKDGEQMAFCFMFNGWGVWHYKHIENKLCELLANFSYAEASALADEWTQTQL